MSGSDDSIVSVRTAGFWRRLLAFGLDGVLVATGAILVGLLAGVLDLAALPDRHGNWFDFLVDIWNAQPGVLVGPLVLFAVLFFLYDTGLVAVAGTTPGRRAVGVELFDSQGARPTVGRAALRAALRLVSVAAFGAGALWVAFQRERRGWHDQLSGTWAGRRQER